jgi:hypothetical protein
VRGPAGPCEGTDGFDPAYRDVGSNRGAAPICGTTHKPVKRIVEQHQASSGGAPVQRVLRARSYDEVADLVAEKVQRRR